MYIFKPRKLNCRYEIVSACFVIYMHYTCCPGDTPMATTFDTRIPYKKTCVTSNSRNYLVFRMGTIALWWEAGLPNKHPLLAPLTPGSCPFLNEADLIMLFLLKILYNIVQVPVFSFSSRFPQTGEFRFSPGFMSPCLPPTARSPIQFMSPT